MSETYSSLEYGVTAVGAEHHYEDGSRRFVEGLKAMPVARVAPLIGDKEAVEKHLTRPEVNFALAYDPTMYPGTPVARRAQFVLARCALTRHKVSFHDLLPTAGVRTAQIDRGRGVSQDMLNAFGALAIEHVVVTDYRGFTSDQEEAVVIEMQAADYTAKRTDNLIREVLYALANREPLPPKRVEDFSWHALQSFKIPSHIGPEDLGKIPGLEPFKVLEPEYAALLGYPGEQISLMAYGPRNERGGFTDVTGPPVSFPDTLVKIHRSLYNHRISR